MVERVRVSIAFNTPFLVMSYFLRKNENYITKGFL